MNLSDVQVGAELLCWMRLGLALGVAKRGDGSLYRFVPERPRKAGPNDLTRFSGLVMANDPVEKVITVYATRNDSNASVAYNRESPLVADISYTAFRRVRLYSTIHVEPRTENYTFPANFVDAAAKPFRTLVDVKLV